MGIGFTGTFSCDAVFACALAIDVFSWEEETSAFAVLEESAELAAVPILEASSEAVESRTFSLDGGGAAMALAVPCFIAEEVPLLVLDAPATAATVDAEGEFVEDSTPLAAFVALEGCPADCAAPFAFESLPSVASAEPMVAEDFVGIPAAPFPRLPAVGDMAESESESEPEPELEPELPEPSELPESFFFVPEVLVPFGASMAIALASAPADALVFCPALFFPSSVSPTPLVVETFFASLLPLSSSPSPPALSPSSSASPSSTGAGRLPLPRFLAGG